MKPYVICHMNTSIDEHPHYGEDPLCRLSHCSAGGAVRGVVGIEGGVVSG